MAEEVPRLMAMRDRVSAPLPTLLLTPSPIAGSQPPSSGSFISTIDDSCSGSIESSARSDRSHSQVRRSNNPVADAIEMLHTSAPVSHHWKYSAKDIQWRVRRKACGSASASQASLAGQ